MTQYSVKLSLPAAVSEFSAMHSKIEKPSGFSYIILTMINSGLMHDSTWKEILGEFDIPVDMFDMFQREILNMCENGMLAYDSAECLDEDCPVSKVTMTERGREVFREKKVAVKPEPFNGFVVFSPASGDHQYFPYSSFKKPLIQRSTGQFDVEPDKKAITATIIDKKHNFGVGKDDDVYDVSIEDSSKMQYSAEVRSEFDNVSGTFSIIDTAEYSASYLKSIFNAEDIISSMGGWVFESPQTTEYVLKWREFVPDWKNKEFILPSNIRFGKEKLCFYNKDTYNMIGGTPINLLEGYDALVKSGFEYYGYCFVNKDVTVNGFEGSVKCHMAIRCRVDDSTAMNFIQNHISSMDIESMDGFKSVLEMATSSGFDNICLDVISRKLSITTEISPVLFELKNKYGKAAWIRDVAAILEKELCKRTSIDTICEAIDATQFRIDGREAAKHFRTDDMVMNLECADNLCRVASSKAIIDSLELGDNVIDAVLSDGFKSSPKSTFFKSATNACKNLSLLKHDLNLKSLSNFTFDLDKLDSESKAEICAAAKILNSEMQELRKTLGHNLKFKQLDEYCEKFTDISSALDGKTVSLTSTELEFGIKIGIRIESALKSHVEGNTLGEMIEDAYDKDIISDSELSFLREMRVHRNICAHESSIPVILKKVKKEWMDIIDRIEKRMKNQ